MSSIVFVSNIARRISLFLVSMIIESIFFVIALPIRMLFSSVQRVHELWEESRP